jgi:hypothetical protein
MPLLIRISSAGYRIRSACGKLFVIGYSIFDPAIFHLPPATRHVLLFVFSGPAWQ